MIPLAKLLRKKDSEKKMRKNKTLTDIEKRIQELEQSLNENDTDDDDEDDDHEEYISSHFVTELDENGNICKVTSALTDDLLIKPLPKYLLPAPNCTKKYDTRSSEKKCKATKVHFANNEDSIDDMKKSTNGSSGSVKRLKTGLELTIEEHLKNYEPASVEKRPFYCRVCRYTGIDIDDLNKHRETEVHKLAFQKERKLSFCNVCHKQFTSPAQLKEHLKGNSHHERVSFFKRAQGRYKNR